MAMSRRVAVALVAIGLLSLTLTGAAHGQVPTPADFAACNREAHQGLKAQAVSPNAGDHTRAESARATATTASSTDPARRNIESPDPQIHGMEAEGSRSAPYQAAYRSCMRRKGF
jgi:hypothetical protein